MPNVSVATDKLFEVEINLYKLESEVVATTPFKFVVMIALFSVNARLLKLIKLVVDISPLIIEVKVLTTEVSEF